MNISRDKLMELIIEVLTLIQEISGRDVPDINYETVPIVDLSGFDSLSGVEMTVMLSERVALPEDMNLCVSKDGTRALSVGEMVDWLIDIGNPSTGGKK